MKMWTLHGALFCGEGGEFASPRGRRSGSAGLETVVRGGPQRFGITVTSEMEVGACVLTQVPAEKRTAQLIKVKLCSSGSRSGVRTTSALTVIGSFVVTGFSSVEF